MKKLMLTIALAVLLAGSAGFGAAPSSVASCYYDDCGCPRERDDAIVAANYARDKGISGCTNPVCIDRVLSEHRQQLDRIERDYQLCLSFCHVGSWF